jgi:hypothetical protein
MTERVAKKDKLYILCEIYASNNAYKFKYYDQYDIKKIIKENAEQRY